MTWNELWLLYLLQEFSETSQNHWTLADTGLVKEHDTTLEDTFSVCYSNTEVCCNLWWNKTEDDHCILRLSVQARVKGGGAANIQKLLGISVFLGKLQTRWVILPVSTGTTLNLCQWQQLISKPVGLSTPHSPKQKFQLDTNYLNLQ